VESFSTEDNAGRGRGTVQALNYTDIDSMCSGDCTGLGVYCYTQNPNYVDCTGGNPCTEGGDCTYGVCSNDCETAFC
jgi:hypothetical protein